MSSPKQLEAQWTIEPIAEWTRPRPNGRHVERLRAIHRLISRWDAEDVYDLAEHMPHPNFLTRWSDRYQEFNTFNTELEKSVSRVS